MATCEECGFAEERGQLAAAVAEADTHEGETGHRTRIVSLETHPVAPPPRYA